MRKRAVGPIPEHSQQRGGVPTPQEATHFIWTISAVFPQQSRIDQEPESTEGEEARDDPVPKINPHQGGFNTQKSCNQEFGAHSSDRSGCRSPSAQEVGLDVHHLTENMRVHGKQRAKQEGLPWQLRSVVQPAAQDETEQVASLNTTAAR